MNGAFKFEVRERYHIFFFFFSIPFFHLFFRFLALFPSSFKKYQEIIEVLKKRQCVHTRIPRKKLQFIFFLFFFFLIYSFIEISQNSSLQQSSLLDYKIILIKKCVCAEGCTGVYACLYMLKSRSYYFVLLSFCSILFNPIFFCFN